MARDPFTSLPVPVELSDAPRIIPGQQALPLGFAGYREPSHADAVDADMDLWMRDMLLTHGAGPEGSR